MVTKSVLSRSHLLSFAFALSVNVKEKCMHNSALSGLRGLLLCLEIGADVFAVHSKAEMKF